MNLKNPIVKEYFTPSLFDLQNQRIVSVEDILAIILGEEKNLLVYGERGIGKTAFLDYLENLLKSNQLKTEVVSINAYESDICEDVVSAAIQKKKESKTEVLKANKVILLIDGIDDLSINHRDFIIDKIISKQNAKNLSIVVTSELESDLERFSTFHPVEVQSLNSNYSLWVKNSLDRKKQREFKAIALAIKKIDKRYFELPISLLAIINVLRYQKGVSYNPLEKLCYKQKTSLFNFLSKFPKFENSKLSKKLTYLFNKVSRFILERANSNSQHKVTKVKQVSYDQYLRMITYNHEQHMVRELYDRDRKGKVINISNYKNDLEFKKPKFKAGKNDLVIQPLFPGLGDNLWWTHLPRMAKESGKYDRVLLSDKVKFRNQETKYLLWEINPYLDGYSEDKGSHFGIEWEIMRIYSINKKQLYEKNFLDFIIEKHNIPLNKVFSTPELYFQPRNISLLNDSLLYDPNYISNSRLNSVDYYKVNRYFNENRIEVDFQMDYKKSSPTTNNIWNLRYDEADFVSNFQRNIPIINYTSSIKCASLRDFCDVLFSSKHIYSLTTGTATLCSSMNKKVSVLLGQELDYCHHLDLSSYINISKQ